MTENMGWLSLYEGLRVTDVCDGLDAIGLIDTCTMDWQIRPLWRDIEGFAHRIYGLAHTVRFVPTSRIWHKVAVATGGSYTPFKTFHTGRSNTLYARRHLGPAAFTVFLGANVLALTAALVRELPKGNARAVVAGQCLQHDFFS